MAQEEKGVLQTFPGAQLLAKGNARVCRVTAASSGAIGSQTLRCCLISSLPFTHCLLGTSPRCCSLATPRVTALHLQGKLPRGAQTGTVQADGAFNVQLVMLFS